MANSLKHVMSANLVRDIAVTGQKVAPDNMWGDDSTIWALHIGQAPRFGHLKYLGHFLFNSHQAWYMIYLIHCIIMIGMLF